MQVSTAVPAFVGYTEFAHNGVNDLFNKPFRITSYTEYLSYFGSHPDFKFEVKKAQKSPSQENIFTLDSTHYFVSQTHGEFLLSRSIKLFFNNGVGACYIVAVSSYVKEREKDKVPENPLEASKLLTGIQQLENEQEHTMLVIPDAVLLGDEDYHHVQQAVLTHCSMARRNRFAILDVPHSDKKLNKDNENSVEQFRQQLNQYDPSSLAFAAAYYPWLHTSILDKREITIDLFNADIKKIVVRPSKHTQNLA